MKLSPRDQIIVSVVLITLGALGFLVLFIVPQFGSLATLDDELQDIEQRKTAAETTLARRQEMKARAAETQVQLLDLASRFPETPELPALIIELQDVANTAEIEFIQITPTTPAAEGDVSSLPVNMSVTGEWKQLIDFLELLRDLRREIRIANLTVSSVAPETGPEPGADEGPDVEAPEEEEEEQDYTIEAQVGIEAYMMNAELAPDAAAPPGAPNGSDS